MDQNNISPWKCLFLFTLTTSLKLREIKPTQSNKVPKPGYTGRGKKQMWLQHVLAKVSPKEKGEWDGFQLWCQISSKLRSFFFSRAKQFNSFQGLGWIFSWPVWAFPVVLQIDSHHLWEKGPCYMWETGRCENYLVFWQFWDCCCFFRCSHLRFC